MSVPGWHGLELNGEQLEFFDSLFGGKKEEPDGSYRADKEVLEHEDEESVLRKANAPAWDGNPLGWASRSLCDECRKSLAYIGGNLFVPIGTPILCGPCAYDDNIRAKWGM